VPLVIDATVGGTSSNSYCTLAEARAYYVTNPLATDPNLDDDEKLTQLLVTATRLLNEHVVWEGVTATVSQRLLFPRTGIWKLSGYAYDTGVIPEELKNGEAELARQLSLADLTADNDLAVQGITHVKAGPVELAFENPGPKVIPDAVYSMIQHLGFLRDFSGSARVVRV
jgi:hypothetical protein